MSRIGPGQRLLSVKAETPEKTSTESNVQADYEGVFDHARTLVGASVLGEAGVRCTALVLKQQQLQHRVNQLVLVFEPLIVQRMHA